MDYDGLIRISLLVSGPEANVNTYLPVVETNSYNLQHLLFTSMLFQIAIFILAKPSVQLVYC